jgi:hypothetical protein
MTYSACPRFPLETAQRPLVAATWDSLARSGLVSEGRVNDGGKGVTKMGVAVQT